MTTKDQKGLLIAMAIGDGYIRQNRPTHLCIIHSEKQREYIEYKASIIQDITGSNVNIHSFDNSGYNGCRLEKSIEYMRFVRKWLYVDRKKYITRRILNKLTRQGIAIWYMDDGSLSKKKRNGKIHAYDLSISTYCSEKEIDEIIQYFSEVWDVLFTKKGNKGKFSIRCGTIQARKFISIIEEFIIPSMRYKIEIPKRFEPQATITATT